MEKKGAWLGLEKKFWVVGAVGWSLLLILTDKVLGLRIFSWMMQWGSFFLVLIVLPQIHILALVASWLWRKLKKVK